MLDCEASLSGEITNFQNNHARLNIGGAVFMVGTTLLLGGKMATFVNNSAMDAGGGILILNSSRLIITTEEINFVNNTAINQSILPMSGKGGGLCGQASEVQSFKELGE